MCQFSTHLCISGGSSFLTQWPNKKTTTAEAETCKINALGMFVDCHNLVGSDDDHHMCDRVDQLS